MACSTSRLLAPGFKLKHSVQSIEFEEIAMGFAGRRAGTAIADLAKVVATLTPTPPDTSSTLLTPSGKALAWVGRSKRTQWVQVPTGAPGSSAINVKLCVPGGGVVHESAGETSEPSQVNFVGIFRPFEKLGLEIANVMGSAPCRYPTGAPELRGSRANDWGLSKPRTGKITSVRLAFREKRE
jgi:hypothetical protein